MKTPKRITKAIAVIIIVGIGLFYNLNKKITMSGFMNSSTITLNDTSIKSDSLRSGENRLFIYTRNIINEGIHHLISNL